MSLAFFADSLAILIGLGVLAVGARFLFMPRAAAAGYGVPADPSTPGTGPYLTIKGVATASTGCWSSSCSRPAAGMCSPGSC